MGACRAEVAVHGRLFLRGNTIDSLDILASFLPDHQFNKRSIDEGQTVMSARD